MVNVMFKIDPNVVDGIFNTFGDSHLVNEGTQENPDLYAIPNSSTYQCPTCKLIKSVDRSQTKTYLRCNGKDEKTRHEEAFTNPVDFRPILKSPGIYYLLGQVRSSLNANIATANSSTSDSDTKKKITLEDRMKINAFSLASTGLAVIIGGYRTYCSDWIINEKKLHSVFSVGFQENYLINMTNNILSNLNKGKGMAAAGRAMDTKVDTTSHTSSEVVYPNQQSNRGSQQSTMDKLSNMFGGGNG